MIRNLKLVGVLGMLVGSLALSQPVLADGFAFNFRGGQGGGQWGGGGRGGATPAPVSNQQQFFNQSSGRQQQFFAQPVFPHSNFNQNQALPFQPAFVPPSIAPRQTWVSPSVNYYLPPQYYASYQPGFYVAPTYYGSGTTIYVQQTTVYQTQQPTNSYASTPQPRLTFGMIGRW